MAYAVKLRLLTRRPRLSRIADPAIQLIERADAARDRAGFVEALELYRRALSAAVTPMPGIEIQAGHMAKEARDYAAAEVHYLKALKALPHSAELALQLGHFYKTIHRMDAALDEYRRAARLSPGWAEPKIAALSLERRSQPPPELDPFVDADLDIVSDLLPRPIGPRGIGLLDDISLLHFGRRPEWTRWGMLPVFAGVEAIRGACHTDERVVEVLLMLAGKPFARDQIQVLPSTVPGIFKAVFNVWADFSSVPPGAHMFEIVLRTESGRAITREAAIFVELPILPEAGALSDGYILPRSIDGGDVSEGIRALPSVVRPARRRCLEIPERIAVLRTDQLGDVVVSIPALRRLRALFPAARITGLLTAANVDMARTLDLFDDIIVVDFPDDFERRQRTMTKVAQQALRARLKSYRFDLAIDFATSHMSRGLLRLTGAMTRFGFDESSWPWMEGGVSGSFRDPANGLEAAPQSGRILAMVERIATLVAPPADILPRRGLERLSLAASGIAANARYAVLHAGARVAFSRWPHFLELARRLLEETSLTVVLLTDDVTLRETLPSGLHDDPRFILLDQRTSFDALDSLLSFADLFIGNDSGPKHLASLRGTPTLGIHCARVNWSEWAQEHGGLVISRRVPCAGCAIFHDPEDCGKGHVCMTDIKVDEVLEAGLSLLADEPGRPHGSDEPAGGLAGL